MKRTARAALALLLAVGLVFCCARGASAENRIGNEKSLLKLLAAYRVSGMEHFRFSLTQEYFEELSADDFGAFSLIAARAGLTDYRITYYSDGKLDFEQATWTEPHIAECGSVAEAEDAVRGMIRAGAESFTLILPEDLFALLMDESAGTAPLPDVLVHAGIFHCRISYSERSGVVAVQADAVYPGTRILAAAEGGDTSPLTAREKQAMAAAEEMAEACLREDALSTARAVHDALCGRVAYINDESTEEDDTAVGALLNGQANCDGYADAFFLVGSLAGLEVRYQHGNSCRQDPEERYEGVSHLWNLIRIGGSWRLVDVTWDDQEDRIVHSWFNIGADRARLTHVWNEKATVPLAEETAIAERPENEYLVRDMEEAKAAARDAARNGYESFTLVMEGDLSREETAEMISRVLRRSISCSWNDYMHTLTVSFAR